MASTSIREKLLLQDREIDRTTYGRGSSQGCLEGTAYHVEVGDPYPAGEFMAAGNNDSVLTSAHFLDAPADAIRQLQENIRLGVCGSSQEEGLEAMRLVIEENPTFWRPGGKLVVLFFSDEEDASDMDGEFFHMIYDPNGPASENGLVYARTHPDYRDELTPVETYRDFLDIEAARRGGTVAIAAIVSAVGEPPHHMEAQVWPNPEDYNCFDPVCAHSACIELENCDPASDSEEHIQSVTGGMPYWCAGDSPGQRYLELASMFDTDDHMMDAICQTDFSGTLDYLLSLADPDS